MQEELAELVERLQQAHKDRLVSVILYGSGAADDRHEGFSDLNVLCVLTGITVSDLARSEPVFAWWHKRGNPAPLLLSEEEVQRSADCFPIEFHDIVERRRLLFGKDVIAGLVIGRTFYRAQVEHELRSKLLRLRQKAGAVLSDGKALLRLMLDSVSTFCVLARHSLLLSGVEVSSKKRDVANRLGELGADPAPFQVLLDLREQRKDDTTVEPAALLASYLKEIEAVVAHVDGLQR
jgi:hypothetical protein